MMFIQVMRRLSEDDITQTEIIRASDLLKMYKVNGDEGRGIGFVFLMRTRDGSKDKVVDWQYICITSQWRDELWSQYYRQLIEEGV